MNQIEFKIEASTIRPSSDIAYLVPGQHDPCEAIVEAVIQALGINVEVTAGGVTLHLAAWQDPEHWSSDWTAKGIDDPHASIAGLVAPYDRPLLRDRETSS